MWTGGKPPLIPSAAVSSSDKSPTTVIFNRQRNAELEALKQRGLAKILNKHFTETTNRLAQEKAAADAAIADLEARKAATSEFQAAPGELSPLDTMCLRANQWRSECRRKERETLLLYQRYVHKFGTTGHVAIPNKGVAATAHKQRPLGTLIKQPKSWVPSVTVETSKTSAPPPLESPRPSPSATLVPGMAVQIESTLEEYLKQGALSQPSTQILGKDETFQTKAQKEEAEFRAFYRRQLEEKGVDVRASDTNLVERAQPSEVDPFKRNVEKGWIDSAVASIEATLPCHTILEDIEEDDCSVVSGLTTLHSAVTREVLMDCELSVADFLREEQANIRKIMEEQGVDDEEISFSHPDVDLSKKATLEAESMVQKMEEILNEYQSKQAAMLAPVDGATPTSSEPRRFPTDNPDENWIVYYDDFYQQEYYHEKNSNRTQWEAPCVDNSVSSGNSPSAASVADQMMFSHTEVMPELSSDNVGYKSRISKYRRKRRKARRRKCLVAVLMFAVVAAVGFYSSDTPALMNRFVSLQHVVEKYYSLWTGKDMIIVKEKDERPNEEEAQEFLRLLEQATKEAQLQKAEERAEADRQNALLQRPFFCNIPFSYLFHSRCRRLASQNPIFDLQSLVASMMQ